MKSYYMEMADLIINYNRGRIRPYTFTTGITEFKKPSLFQRIKMRFEAFKKEKKTVVPPPPPLSKEPLGIKILTSFSGADLVVTIGSEVVGELSNIRWYKPHQDFLDKLPGSGYYDKALAIQKPVVLLVEWAVFDKDVVKTLKDATITLTFANEYGQSAYRAIHGVNSLYEIGGTGIDDIVQEGYMILAAEEVTELKEGIRCVENFKMQANLEELKYKAKDK